MRAWRRNMIRASGCIAFVASAMAVRAAAAPTAGAELLGDAPAYALLRPALAFEVLGEVNAVVSKSSPLHRRLFERVVARAKRELGFDPTSRSGAEQVGIDLSAPVWAAMGSFDEHELKSAHAKLQRVVAGALRGGAPLAQALGKFPFITVRTRVVFGVKDLGRLRGFLRRVGFLAEDGPALVTRLARRSGQPAAEALGRGLAKLHVLGVEWMDRHTLAVMRMVGARRAVLDVFHAWLGDARALDAAGARGVLRHLALPSRGPLARGDPLVTATFTSEAGLALWLRSAPLLKLAELSLEQSMLSTIPYLQGSSAARVWKAGQGDLRRCVKAWRGVRGLTGDTALRLTATKRSWHVKVWWALPSRATRSLGRAVVSDASIDPKGYEAAVAFAGTNLALGKVGKDLSKGPFRKRIRDIVRLANECPTLMLATASTGGWLGLLGTVSAAAKREPDVRSLVDGVQNGIVVVRSLPNRRTSRGSRQGAVVAHFALAKGGPVRAKLEAALAKGGARKSSFASGGAKTTVYTGLRGLEELAVGLTEERGGAAALTIAHRNRVEDIMWLLRRHRPSKGVLPASVLVYGHLNIPAMLDQVTASLPHLAREMVGAPLRALGDRVGRLRGNISLAGGRLVGEIRLDRN